MTGGYEDLCRITDAVYQADLARMRRLAADEAGLRATLDDLDRQLRDSLGGQFEGEASWRAVGADEAWRKWLIRRRVDVNTQLARTLVRKAEATEQLRLAFARKQVSADLLNQQREADRLARSRRA